MAKPEIKSNPRVKQIFEDLEKFLNFCKDYGYVFDEKELYSNKSYTYRQFNKFLAGKPVKDNWSIDTKQT
jgi:hypothetical protein